MIIDILIFSLGIVINFSVFADNRSQEGEQTAKEMLNKSVISSTTSQSGNKTLENLGISANTVGYPSSGQRNDMGVSGKSISQFNFLIRPTCNSKQSLLGLNGTKIIILASCSHLKTSSCHQWG